MTRRAGILPSRRVPRRAELVALACCSKRNLAARALYRNFDRDLNAHLAQRSCLRAKSERYERLVLILYDIYDHQLSNAVPRSPFYTHLGVESVRPLIFQYVKKFKTSEIDSKAPLSIL